MEISQVALIIFIAIIIYAIISRICDLFELKSYYKQFENKTTDESDDDNNEV